jgi:hypothetical protein
VTDNAILCCSKEESTVRCDCHAMPKLVRDLLTNTLWQCGGAGSGVSCTRTIQLYRDTPAIQGHSSCTGTLQLYRDASAGQVSGAEVAAGGNMGPVYIYRHPLLLR